MALPPRGDPLRAVHLAVRVMRVIGTFLVLCALTVLLTVTFRSSDTMTPEAHRYYLRLGPSYGLPGVLYLLLAQFLIRRRMWAAIASLLLTVVALVVVLVFAIYVGLEMSQSPWTLVMLIPVGLIELFPAALVWLLFLLARSIASLRRLRAGGPIE